MISFLRWVAPPVHAWREPPIVVETNFAVLPSFVAFVPFCSSSRNIRAGQDQPRHSFNKLDFREIEQQLYSGLCLRWEQEETKGTKDSGETLLGLRDLSKPRYSSPDSAVNRKPAWQRPFMNERVTATEPQLVLWPF